MGLKNYSYLCTIKINKQFNNNTMGYENLDYKNFRQAKVDVGVSYMGRTSHSPKLIHSLDNKEISTYGIYLAPADLSGYNVCPNSSMCKEHCLFGSGQTMMDILSNKNRTVQTRIKKTRLFFENKPYFMNWVVNEIKLEKLKAELNGYAFSVRINCTSDISINDLEFNGVNICNIFPDVQFYDYTKVYDNLKYTKMYPNYDLTYSYNGVNWTACEKALSNGNRVAVVFEKKLPKTFNGYRVIDGDLYDARYIDDKNVIVGLKLKMVANNIKNGKYVKPTTKFVVKFGDERCEW